MPDVIRVCPIPILFVGLFFICLICSCIFLTLSESAGFHLKNKKERKKRTTVYEKCHSSVVVLLSSPVLCSYIFISIPTHLLQNFHWSFLMFWFHFYPPSLSLSLSLLTFLFFFSFFLDGSLPQPQGIYLETSWEASELLFHKKILFRGFTI